jgi:hypothetical protein
MKRLIDLVEREEEVVMADLDAPDQARLKLLIEMCMIAKVRNGPWSGQPYYGIPDNRKGRKGHQKYVCRS